MSTTKRRPRKQHAGRVTADAVALYREGDRMALHTLLRLPPWQVSPLEAIGDCPWPAGSGGAQTWADSVALREAMHGHG